MFVAKLYLQRLRFLLKYKCGFGSKEVLIMKNSLRKNLITILAVCALVFFSAAIAILGTHKRAYAQPASEVSAESPCGGDHTTWTEITSSPIEFTTGNYYLTKNVKLSYAITIAANQDVTICLNGYVLCGNGDGNVINVNNGATLNICDCREESTDVKHKHYYYVDESGLWNFTNDSGNFLTSGDGDKFVTGGVIAGGKYSVVSTQVYYGSGIYNEGELTLKSGMVAGNKALMGGGIYNSGTLTVSGGTICGNIAQMGGGVVVNNGAGFTMSGGKITGNAVTRVTASTDYLGGGVYNHGTFKVYGKPVITDNYSLDEGDKTANNVFVFSSGDYISKIIVNGELTDGARIGILTGNDVTDPIADYSVNNSGVNPNVYFSEDTGTKLFNADGTLTVHTHETGAEAYRVLDGKGGEVGAAGETSYYCLARNTTLENNLTIATGATVTICLNGYILCGNGNGSVITVDSGATLNICDCQAESTAQEHKHYYTVESDGLWKFKDTDGNFLTSGEEDMCVTGGVITGGFRNFVLTDTYLYGNGGGIYVQGALNLTGGAICGNKAYDNGGGVFLSGSETDRASFNMSGGAVCGNVAYSGNGGGVNADNYCTFTMSGGTVASNRAATNGGVSAYNHALIQITGGSILKNRARATGGVSVNESFGSALQISGNPQIYDNVLTSSGNPASNCYVTNPIIIAGALQEGAKIGLSYGNGKIDMPLTSGYGTQMGESAANFSSYFTHDDCGHTLYLSEGEIYASNTYDLTLNLYKDGASYVTDDTITTYKYGEGVNDLPQPARDGYIFDGWYVSDDFTGEPITQIPAMYYGNRTYYAKWTQIANLFGEDVKFGSNNLWDCQRSPRYPIGGSPFYIHGLKAPLDVKGNTINLTDGEYVIFAPYAGDGEVVTDKDGNGVITVAELKESDRSRIVGTLYANNSNATSEQAILNAVVVSEIKYTASGNSTLLANIGLIWALEEEGFLYTALDPDCLWSWSGGVGTFITFKPQSAQGGLSYTPTSSDPLNKDDFDTDDGGNDVVLVPKPDNSAPTGEEKFVIIGIVVDGDGNPLAGAEVSYQLFIDAPHNTTSDENGYFFFNNLAISDLQFAATFGVSYETYGARQYDFAEGALENYSLVRLVYPLNGSDAGSAFNDVVNDIKYMNMEGAGFGGQKFPIAYTEGVGVGLVSPLRADYSFGGWYETADFSGEKVDAVSAEKTGTVTLYAKWIHTVHTWDGGAVTKAPTCTDKGEKTFTCTECGATRTEEIAIDVNAHSWGEWTVTTPATCTEEGEETCICAHNNSHIQTRKIQATGHSWGEWSVTKPATENEEGEEARSCTRCGATQTQSIPAIPKQNKKSSLLWLIILLAVVLAAEVIVLILRISAIGKKRKNNGAKLGAVLPLPLLAAAYPMGEIVAVIVLAAAVVAVGIVIAGTFINKNERAPEEPENGTTPPDNVPDSSFLNGGREELAVSDGEEQAAETDKDNGEQIVLPDTDGEEEHMLESEVEAEFVDDEDDGDVDGGLSLKESLALAAEHALIKINKSSVAKWLEDNFGEEVKLNRRANKTKTGLPLADTHYVFTGAKNKCFVYVYELDDDKAMLLLKTDGQTAEEIAQKYPSFVKSRFPKSRREQWYTLIPDSGFSSSDEVFAVIALVLSKYTENLRAAGEEVRKEIARLQQVMKDNVTAEEVKTLVSDEAAGVLVSGRRSRRSGKKFAVNIDTLSENYQADDTVDIDNLKEIGIVPKGANQIKILARGTLDKPLTVIADDFSADAIKMIVLTGGEALWS